MSGKNCNIELHHAREVVRLFSKGEVQQKFLINLVVLKSKTFILLVAPGVVVRGSVLVHSLKSLYANIVVLQADFTKDEV